MTMLLLMLLIGPSAMACMVPEAQLTPVEQKCCKMMSHHCGGMAGQSSHSCCKTAVVPDNAYCAVQRVLSSAASSNPLPAITANAAMPLPLASLGSIVPATSHPPPEIFDRTVLRI
jgi:hypothetical protein